MKRNLIIRVVLSVLFCLSVLSSCQSVSPPAFSDVDVSAGSYSAPVQPLPEVIVTPEPTPIPPSESASEPEVSPQPEPPPAPEPEPIPMPEPAPQPETPASEPAPEPTPAPPVPDQSAPPPTPAPEPASEPATPTNTKLYILMYHHFVEDGVSYNDWTTTVSRFQEDLQWLSDQGYTLVLPSDLARGDALPEKAAMLTIDDGYASNYKLAYPILQQFQAKAVISLIVKRIEDGNSDFLTWDMCREMADSGLIEFGSHTYDCHRNDPRGIKRMSGESREDYEARVLPDLQTSIDLIRDNLGREVLFFAYPHGQTEAWAKDFLKEHFSVTVTTQHGPADISKGLYAMPRHNITVSKGVSAYLP